MDRMREMMLRSSLFISKRSLLEDTKAISIPEKNAEKAIVIKICMMMLPIDLLFSDRLDSSDRYAVLADTVLRCVVGCSGLVFYGEDSCRVADDIVRQFLVGFESVTGDGLVFLFDTDELVRIDFLVVFVPE